MAVVYNPVAGRGAGRLAAARLAAVAAARGDRIDLLGTGRAIDARTAAREAAESGAERVIAIGGDGTVVEVAAGLLALSDPPPLAIVPQGTANLLALNLGVPHDRESAIQAAFSSRVGRIDCGRANGEPFLIAVGAGVHADVIARADRSSKKRWGVAAYGIAGWHATRGVTPALFTIEIDGEKIEIEATTVQVMNVASVIRRGWEFAHGVSPVDGILDVVAHRASTLAEHIVTAAAVVRGAPTDTDLVVHRRGQRVRVDVDPAATVQRDGEVAGRTPVEIDVLPQALPVVLPEGSPWTS
ncbi:MAG TPA: YegS/Rv2252/BmrU family lipid kinase [Gemmatimonadota bacterium]|nr:YegS/Rv2252/BmrU family lipid kinase [Gemmatimonadota bacterium]